MSRLPAAMCTWDSLSVLGNSRRTSTEVGMMHWARWSATVVVAALVAAPLCGQGSGGAAEPAAPPHAVVTNEMLLNAAASGDWLMYGHNYWNNRFSPLKTINASNVKNLGARDEVLDVRSTPRTSRTSSRAPSTPTGPSGLAASRPRRSS